MTLEVEVGPIVGHLKLQRLTAYHDAVDARQSNTADLLVSYVGQQEPASGFVWVWRLLHPDGRPYTFKL